MALILPEGPVGAGVLVIHSWWGLTPGYRTFALRLARAGFAVALADLYDGAVATREAEVRALRAKPRRVPMYRTLERDLDELRAAGADRVAVVGFSMGGHWAVWLAQRAQYGLSAAVVYYAARGGDFSEAPPILAHFAETDAYVTPTARKGMERALARAGTPCVAHDYPGTSHWFAEPDQAGAYQPEAADLALGRTIGFLRETLA
jgi:carboxymethylenebutenolidase